MDEKDEEDIPKNCLGIFKKVGFVFSTPEGVIPDLGEIKDGRIVIRGRIEVSAKDNNNFVLSFVKKNQNKEIRDLDRSPDLELYEDCGLFGYHYAIVVPRNQITLARMA